MNTNNQRYTVIFSALNNPLCGQIFVCDQADNEEHAREQVANAYPGCVIHCAFKPETPGWFRVYSPNQAATSGDESGFWSNSQGWVTEDCATLFDIADVKDSVLPRALGQDAIWQFVTQSQASQFSISDKIKGDYLGSGCEASDVDEALARLAALCPELFETPDHAWSFLMEEPHENLEHIEADA
jgi:hypothetical protein